MNDLMVLLQMALEPLWVLWAHSSISTIKLTNCIMIVITSTKVEEGKVNKIRTDFTSILLQN